ncbi:MAG: hypothetical protein ABJB09_07485 [Verrucomicrobiota bacterium]
MTAGSPIWQTVFFSFAAVLILFEVVRGWRLGLIRQLMRVVAIIAAYGTSIFLGPLLVSPLRPYLRIPDIAISAVADAGMAILVYGVIASLGTILFKRTAQQSSGTIRLVYGLSGAAIGLFFGGFFLWLILMGVRSIGAIADAQVNAQEKIERRGSEEADSLAALLARLKNSVELGNVGEVVKKADLMPGGVYQTLSDVGTVLASPESAQRFLAYPGATALGEHPKIVALRNDPEIGEMIAQGRLFELLRDSRIIDAANDPTLAECIKKFDLKKAVDYARERH